MNILYATPEADPFAKSGGLGDVAGSLPKALCARGEDVRVILPLYGSIANSWRRKMRFLIHTYVYLAHRKHYCGLFSLEHNGVTYYFIENESYFRRDVPYGFEDDGARFAFFSKAIVSLLPLAGWTPDIVSCNGWQTALVPIYLRQETAELYSMVRTVLTIHNIESQGRFPKDSVWNVFGLPPEMCDNDHLCYDGEINLTHCAIFKADYLITVSPSYASELKDPVFAFGLHRTIENNSHKLRGILNGLDTEKYDPASDQNIDCAYSIDDIAGKTVCKRELQRYLGLDQDPDTAVIGYIARLASDKGVNLVAEALDRLMAKNVQLVILGTGDKQYEQFFMDAEKQYKGRVSANIVYSDTLAQRIFSGADILLIPSYSEPCGLSQLIAMRYGTVPVVREVGGLKDTVRPYPGRDSNGFLFSYFSADDMLGALSEAVKLLPKRREWEGLMRRGMASDFSWTASSAEYQKILRQLASK